MLVLVYYADYSNNLYKNLLLHHVFRLYFFFVGFYMDSYWGSLSQVSLVIDVSFVMCLIYYTIIDENKDMKDENMIA